MVIRVEVLVVEEFSISRAMELMRLTVAVSCLVEEVIVIMTKVVASCWRL
jgi:hypothetical protein